MSTATESAVLITGNTYPVREQLKALGGRWDARAKGWRVPAARVNEARGLVGGAQLSPVYTGRRGGCVKRGRCEDAPCCGCCD